MKAFACGLVLLGLMSVARPAMADDVEALYKSKCQVCHGADGKAQTDQGKKMAVADMSSAAWQTLLTDDKIKAAISDGVKRSKGGVAQEMEPYKQKLQPAQIDGLVAYVRALKK